MFKESFIPPSFSLVRKGRVSLLLRNDYRDLLLTHGIENPKTFLDRHRDDLRYLSGRSLHPSIPIGNDRRIVMRHYSHGGLFRVFTRDLYLLGSRSFKELALTERILSRGIPTAEPVGAIHQSAFFLFYKAYLLSLEISSAKDLIQYLQEVGPHPSGETLLHKRRTIRSAGRLIRHFHEAGFFHGDLQLRNILVSRDRLFLIDFDRTYEKAGLSLEERKRNLLRLNRSAEKWKSLGLPISRTDRLRFFKVYADKDEEMRVKMREAFRMYSFRRLFYRWSWAFQRVFKK